MDKDHFVALRVEGEMISGRYLENQRMMCDSGETPVMGLS
jgi:hypothetical protein